MPNEKIRIFRFRVILVMRTIFTVFVFLSLIIALNGQGTNTYSSIVNRNAFNLTEEKEASVLPPATNILSGDIYLTGITKLNNVQRVHLVVKRLGASDKYVSLLEKQIKEGVRLERIGLNNAFISDNGRYKLLSFKKHALPSIVSKSSMPKIMQRGDDKKNSKKELRKLEPRASIVKVPSRRPTIDPKIIEKGLEYISRSEDNEKRDYIMKRLESLQSGQSNIKSDIDQNERRRQYDEWKKRRDGK